MKKNNDEYNFFDRELSWLEFNGRVLEEAQDSKNPLFERMKFLAITESNLDEFFMARLISFFDLSKSKSKIRNIAGLLASEKLKKISERVSEMIADMGNIYSRIFIKALSKENINMIKQKDFKEDDIIFLKNYFEKVLYPVITPMYVDASRPFPLIQNNSLNIGVIIKDGKQKVFGSVQVPSVLNRIIYLNSNEDEKRFVLLEDCMKYFIKDIFPDRDIESYACYRVIRNSDIDINEYEDDLLEAVEEGIKQRKWGEVMCLEIEKNVSSMLLLHLVQEFEVHEDFIFYRSFPIDLKFLFKLNSANNNKEKLYYPKFRPSKNKEFIEKDIFSVIKEKDVLLHHPFDSFDPVVDLVWQASEDPSVLAIKQTLYRVSGKSPIIDALVNAAENGKQVMVLVELKARFDEENNISWAKRLEKAGCHVIYGLLGLKVHGKLLLIVRMEEEGIVRYVHLGTGNYNDVTAKMYTDISLFTANNFIGADASKVFNMLSGYSKIVGLNKLTIAPTGLRDKLISLIDKEIENSKNGISSGIDIKVNGLVDENIVNKLYEASREGVKINLIVRGMCILKPGIEGLSENITVTSIVGRFLEHTRIYCFNNGGANDIYLSSADLMSRNIDKRVEIFFPVIDSKIKDEVKNIIETYKKDNIKARILLKEGKYRHIDKRGKELFSAQDYLLNIAENKNSDKLKQKNKIEEFIPKEQE